MNRKRKRKPSKKDIPAKVTPIAAPLSTKKRRVFQLISITLVPLFFFGALELGLRLFGYGYPTSAVIKYKLEDKEVYCQNYTFSYRFFPAKIARQFDGFVFDTQKKPDTYRIFVLGASAAAGVPAPAYNFGHMLEVMLDEMYPEMDFEVHTAAMPAINSHVVVEIAKDCARYQPDLFIVYLGNNEVVGPYGPGTVFSSLSPSISLIRANIAFKATRTGQLIEQTLRELTPRSVKQKQWGGLEMFLDKQIRYDDPALEITYKHFERNLTDICQAGLKAGASVIVSNVASNLKDCPPFSSQHRPDITDPEKQSWQTLYQEGTAYEANKQYEQAIAKYLDAEKIDSTYAELQFRLARCYGNTGDYENAKVKYVAARDYDTLRFRADSRINEIIHTVADNKQNEKLYFVDSIKTFDAVSPNQIPGGEVFYEHVHLKFDGNYLLADTILPYVKNTLPKRLKSNDPRDLSEKEMAELIGYTDYENVMIMIDVEKGFLERPPFTNRLDNEQILIQMQQVIDAQRLRLQQNGLDECLKQHQWAVQNRPDDWYMRNEYAKLLYSGFHEIKAEEEQLREVIKRCPLHSAYLNLGINLHQQGRIKESESILNKLLKMNPTAMEAHVELASICRQRREYENEIKHLLAALSMEPESIIGIHIDLAEAYRQTGKTDKAIKVLYNAIKVFPEENTPPAYALLAYLLYTQRNYTTALNELEHAFTIDPDYIINDPYYSTLLKNLKNMVNQ